MLVREAPSPERASGLQLVRGSEELVDAMAALNSSFTASETALLSGKLFACAMYGEKDGSRDIIQVRYRLFCDPQKARDPRQLPPSEDALLQHTKRANYQAAIWKSALTAAPDQPSPAGHGWQITPDDILQISWLQHSIAPKELLSLVKCRCLTGSCSSRRCACRKSSLLCTDVCGCNSERCQNSRSGVAIQAEEAVVEGEDTAAAGEQSSESDESDSWSEEEMVQGSAAASPAVQ